MLYCLGMPDKNPGMNFGGVELPEGFSEKELRWSYWWINHREQIRKTAIAVFVVIDVLLFGYGAWRFIDYLALSGVKEELAIRAMTGNTYGRLGGIPEIQEIKIDAPTIFSTPSGSYDVIVPVTNPNASYWIELTYQFVYGENETPARKSFVLPGQSKLIAELGIKSQTQPGGIRLNILRRSFHRINRHQIADYDSWLASHTALTAVDRVFVPPNPAATVPTAQTNFTLVNQTAYSYYDVNVIVLAYRGDVLAGVNGIKLSSLSAGESRPIQLFWYQNLQGVTRFDVQTEVNIFDPNAYQKPGL